MHARIIHGVTEKYPRGYGRKRATDARVIRLDWIRICQLYSCVFMWYERFQILRVHMRIRTRWIRFWRSEICIPRINLGRGGADPSDPIINGSSALSLSLPANLTSFDLTLDADVSPSLARRRRPYEFIWKFDRGTIFPPRVARLC